jgi:DNA-binding NarL/FixJ family response regulator
MEQIKVAVAEKHNILRAYVVDLLKGVDQFEIVFDSLGATDLMDKLSRLEVDILVLSTSLLGYDGEDALKIIRESDQVPNLKIIMYSNRTDNLSIEDMAKQGANSFLNKTADY